MNKKFLKSSSLAFARIHLPILRTVTYLLGQDWSVF